MEENTKGKGWRKALGVTAGLMGAAALCLFCVLAFRMFVMGAEEREKSGTLDIEVVDEWPPESELETKILEEEQEALEESDSLFVEMTNMIDSNTDTAWLVNQDGKTVQKEGTVIHINTVKFFVPDGSSRCFGVPNFSTELFADGEWEERRALEEYDLIGDECEEFNGGINVTRQLVKEGILNEEITKLLDRYPQINPHDRAYTLELVNAETVFRQEDETSWWEVDYSMSTRADNGEKIRLAYIDITRVTLSDGEEASWYDAQYRIDVIVENLWQLIENPAEDKGEVWIQQIRGDSFADMESIQRFVEEQGAEIVLPEGVDKHIEWDAYKATAFYYDYAVFQGETADYTVTLAVPLMEKREEGYYLASRIRTEAVDKTACQDTLGAMMQTMRGVPYFHVVREGESLTEIAEKYCGTQEAVSEMQLYDERTGNMQSVTPERIRPGQKLTLPRIIHYDARRDAEYKPHTGN